jgi:hypothetical protein
MYKNIEIDLTLEGQGIINYDCPEQKETIKNYNIVNLLPNKKSNTNIKYGKKVFYRDDNGEVIYKNIISSGTLRHAIFNDSMITKTPVSHSEKNTYMSIYASPALVIRGFMETDEGRSFKNTTAFSLTDAILSNNALSYLEIRTTSGKKHTNEDKSGDASKDTSLHYAENIGETEYKVKGSINLQELQFLSFDDLFDRMSFSPDDFELFKTWFTLRVPEFDSELSYYKMNTSVLNIPELGVKFSQKVVDIMVKELLTNILKLNIRKNGRYTKIKTFKIKLNKEVDIENKNEWIEIKNVDDINKLYFEYEDRYVEVVDEKTIELRKNHDKNTK